MSNATSFKKGRKKTGGRRAGTPNRMPRFFGEAVLAAAEVAGNDAGGQGLVGYLALLARDEPKIFADLLARLLSLQEKQGRTVDPSGGRS